jgi:hypothetical protein
MATPTTKDQFKEYCLRALGKPVIEINVDDDQVDDRFDKFNQSFGRVKNDFMGGGIGYQSSLFIRTNLSTYINNYDSTGYMPANQINFEYAASAEL